MTRSVQSLSVNALAMSRGPGWIPAWSMGPVYAVFYLQYSLNDVTVPSAWGLELVMLMADSTPGDDGQTTFEVPCDVGRRQADQCSI